MPGCSTLLARPDFSLIASSGGAATSAGAGTASALGCAGAGGGGFLEELGFHGPDHDLRLRQRRRRRGTFILDGGSLITDLQLLSTLASRQDVKSYLEIGTWRGESVYNVSKYIDDCTTINLSAAEMKAMGLSPEYAEQHGILSSKNPKILHIGANTKTFDFASLNKKYDLVFIDGEHSYEMVLNDTQKVFKHLLHDNSVVVWHDYAYSPQNMRYEVFQAILDGVGNENHAYLYHPKNTLCAVFTKKKLKSSAFDKMKFPEKIFTVNIEKENFS